MKLEKTKLGNIALIYSGFAFKSNELVKETNDNSIPIIKIKNIHDRKVSRKCETSLPNNLYNNKYEKYKLEKDDILIAMTGQGSVGRIGKMREIDDTYLVNQRVAIVRVNRNNANPEFIYQQISNQKTENYYFNLAFGAGQPNLSPEDIGSLSLIYPPLEIQNKTASILSAYDDLIENNLRRIKLLEEKALIEYNYLKSELKLSRYEKIKLKDILDFKYGKALKADDRTGEGYPVYGSSGIVGKHKDYLVTGPGIVVGRKGNVGSVFWSFDNFWVIDTAYFITSDISLYYLYFNLREQNFVNTDAAVPGLNRNFALDNSIYLPPISSILEFEEKIKPIFNLIHNIQNQNTKLREARDILLPRLMSGEIEV